MGSFNIGDKVIPTAGPYEGRKGTLRSRRTDGWWLVDIEPSEYHGAEVKGAAYDPRNLKPA